MCSPASRTTRRTSRSCAHLDQALALAERSVALHEALGSGHGLAVALASLGQILVQLGDLERAETDTTRTLEVRSPVQFHETTGAVFDSLAQIHLMRGSYERAGEYLRLASDGYGAYGTPVEPLVRVVAARARREARHPRAATPTKPSGRPRSWCDAGLPPAEAIQAELAACEALVAAGRIADAERRLASLRGPARPSRAPGGVGRIPAHPGHGA